MRVNYTCMPQLGSKLLWYGIEILWFFHKIWVVHLIQEVKQQIMNSDLYLLEAYIWNHAGTQFAWFVSENTWLFLSVIGEKQFYLYITTKQTKIHDLEYGTGCNWTLWTTHSVDVSCKFEKKKYWSVKFWGGMKIYKWLFQKTFGPFVQACSMCGQP